MEGINGEGKGEGRDGGRKASRKQKDRTSEGLRRLSWRRISSA